MGVARHGDKRRLIIVEHGPARAPSANLLAAVKARGVHAEPLGF